jgi:hypothetical protein
MGCLGENATERITRTGVWVMGTLFLFLGLEVRDQVGKGRFGKIRGPYSGSIVS